MARAKILPLDAHGSILANSDIPLVKVTDRALCRQSEYTILDSIDRGMTKQSHFLYRQVILIDTSAAISFLDEREAHHKAAKIFFENRQNFTWVSVDVTAHETFTRDTLWRRLPKAIKAFTFLRETPVKHLPFEVDDENKASAQIL